MPGSLASLRNVPLGAHQRRARGSGINAGRGQAKGGGKGAGGTGGGKGGGVGSAERDLWRGDEIGHEIDREIGHAKLKDWAEIAIGVQAPGGRAWRAGLVNF